jgi:hypothetical protein
MWSGLVIMISVVVVVILLLKYWEFIVCAGMQAGWYSLMFIFVAFVISIRFPFVAAAFSLNNV